MLHLRIIDEISPTFEVQGGNCSSNTLPNRIVSIRSYQFLISIGTKTFHYLQTYSKTDKNKNRNLGPTKSLTIVKIMLTRLSWFLYISIELVLETSELTT